MYVIQKQEFLYGLRLVACLYVTLKKSSGRKDWLD